MLALWNFNEMVKPQNSEGIKHSAHIHQNRRCQLRMLSARDLKYDTYHGHLFFFSFAEDASAIAKYRAGFNECAAKVSQFLMTADNITVPVRTQLLSHLASTCQQQKDPHHSPTDMSVSRQQAHATLSSSFPATKPKVGANTAFADGSMATKFPSPPSSPLHNHSERKLLPFPPTMSPSMSPFMLSNGIPALILPNDTALQLLPLTLPANASTAFDTSLWRPWWR